MTHKERNEQILKLLKTQQKKATRTRASALSALVAAGIMTPTGKLAAHYAASRGKRTRKEPAEA